MADALLLKIKAAINAVDTYRPVAVINNDGDIELSLDNDSSRIIVEEDFIKVQYEDRSEDGIKRHCCGNDAMAIIATLRLLGYNLDDAKIQKVLDAAY